MAQTRLHYPVWVRGDLDGFFGLMVDNLVQVLLIIFLCTTFAGMSGDLVFTRVLPGVAISLLIGNLFYGFQAHRVARRDGNANCTALPYGINTPSVFAFVLFIMAPVYEQYKGPLGPEAAGELAWKAGLLACLVSGVIEFVGAFFAERLRKATPRAALLGVLAGVGITFIASDFAFQIFSKPLIGLLPLGILLLAYFAKFRFPGGLPGGFLAVAVGTLFAWGLSCELYLKWFGGSAPMSFDVLRESISKVGWIQPTFCGEELRAVLAQPELLLRFLTVSVPMGLLNALGSLQNIESAEAGGDRYSTAPSLAVNGLGTIAAGLFGSCFPTTIYIGHPAWKALGARAGYSIVNGLFFSVLFLFGLGTFLAGLIPIEAGAAIVMYIGIIITAQAFQATPRKHAPAVAIALFPALAALMITNLPLFMVDAGATRTLAEMVAGAGPTSAVPTLPGMVTLMGANSSWLLTTLILTAMAVALIDRKYKVAAIWCGSAAVLTAIGLLHAYRIDPVTNSIREYFLWQGPELVRASAAAATQAAASQPAVYAYRAFPVAIGYALVTIVLALAACYAKRRGAAAVVGGPDSSLPDVPLPSPVAGDGPRISVEREESEPLTRETDEESP